MTKKLKKASQEILSDELRAYEHMVKPPKTIMEIVNAVVDIDLSADKRKLELCSREDDISLTKHQAIDFVCILRQMIEEMEYD